MSELYSTRKVEIYKINEADLPFVKLLFESDSILKKKIENVGAFLILERLQDTYDDKWARDSSRKKIRIDTYDIYLSIGIVQTSRYCLGTFGYDQGTSIEDILKDLRNNEFDDKQYCDSLKSSILEREMVLYNRLPKQK